MNRRQLLLALAAAGASAALPRLALAAGANRQAVIGAAWRGPNPGDAYFAGALVADWEARTLSIRYAIPLPTRPHGLLAEADVLVENLKPGSLAKLGYSAEKIAKLNPRLVYCAISDRVRKNMIPASCGFSKLLQQFFSFMNVHALSGRVIGIRE